MPDHFRADQNLSMLLRALSEHLLKTERDGALATCLGSLFQCLIIEGLIEGKGSGKRSGVERREEKEECRYMEYYERQEGRLD